jgi:AcrR family transcriptional regulator
MAGDGKLTLVDPQTGKDRILLCAMELFAEKGFDGVTTRDIATKAEVSVGLINHHYGSKEGLRQAVDAYFLEQFERFYGGDGARVEDKAPKEMVRSVDQWIAGIADEWPVFCRYFRRALLEETEWGAALFKRYFEIVRSSIDRLDAQGRIRPEVDRLWLPFLFMFLETGTLLMDPYIKQILGRSGFEEDLWRRRYRAYGDMIARGVFRQSNTKEEPKP